MKTLKSFVLLALVLSGLTGPLTAQIQFHTPCNTPVDQDNFSNSAPWITEDLICGNGSIVVINNALDFSNVERIPPCPNWNANYICAVNTMIGACNGREMRLHRPIANNLTLSNVSWRAECKFRINNGNGPAHTLLGLTAGNGEPQGNRTNCPAWACNGNQNSCP